MAVRITTTWASLKQVASQESLQKKFISIDGYYYVVASDATFELACQIQQMDPKSDEQIDFESDMGIS